MVATARATSVPATLRFLTAGSVDDGKSTLVGRLLYEMGAIPDDQIESIGRSSESSAAAQTTVAGRLDFAFVTDGLKAERQQGITIDVAHRYFASARRRYILADAPGHEQYTRNMATAASTADLALLLVDGAKGASGQTRRHALIAWLLGVRQFIVAINKMDLCGFSRTRYLALATELEAVFQDLSGSQLQCIPTVATTGENVLRAASSMPWYTGPTIFDLLEAAPVARANLGPLRMVVQSALREPAGGRLYAGRIATGIARVGAAIFVNPGGCEATIRAIHCGKEPVESASAGKSVALALDRDLDVGRGAIFAGPASSPLRRRHWRAVLLWMDESSANLDVVYSLRHSLQYVPCRLTRVAARLDPEESGRGGPLTLGPNQIAEVEIETTMDIYADPYSECRETGSFILIAPVACSTIAAGLFLGPSAADPQSAPDGGTVIWLTGLSSAGKSTLAALVCEQIKCRGERVEWLDGDEFRKELGRGLGFTQADREENVRRITYIASMLARHGVVVIVSAISPYRSGRNAARRHAANFIEVYVNAPLATCEQRDVHGVYRRARNGEIENLTGVDDPYEQPLAPEVECMTALQTPEECCAAIVRAFERARGM